MWYKPWTWFSTSSDEKASKEAVANLKAEISKDITSLNEKRNTLNKMVHKEPIEFKVSNISRLQFFTVLNTLSGIDKSRSYTSLKKEWMGSFTNKEQEYGKLDSVLVGELGKFKSKLPKLQKTGCFIEIINSPVAVDLGPQGFVQPGPNRK